jgi:hypothetical protein
MAQITKAQFENLAARAFGLTATLIASKVVGEPLP